MHEIGLIQTALQLAEEQARRYGAARIRRIHLRVGRLAGAEPEALALAFEVAKVGTLAELGVLEVETVPATGHCQSCAVDFTTGDFILTCPRCGQPCGDLRAGQELELAFLEVSDGDD
jgi:hydrogenase nickel incorporation protein HypA/HybF